MVMIYNRSKGVHRKFRMIIKNVKLAELNVSIAIVFFNT